MRYSQTWSHGKRQARAAGEQMMKIVAGVDPTLRDNIALIYEDRQGQTPEQNKRAAILRALYEEGLAAVGCQILEAANAEVA